MSRARPAGDPPGPFRAGLVREGDHIEISRGYAILTMAGSGKHAAGSLFGGEIVDSDPLSPGAGVDVGCSPDQLNLRAPDVAVTPHTDAEGWVPEYPSLAIEYAGRYQRESELQDKIQDLLGGGTQILWVVRLQGERHVEVHEPGRPMRVARPGEKLEAPGVLANPILVEALWDRSLAHDHTLRNLLQRRGYADLEEVLAKGRAEGRVEGLAEGELEGKASALLLILETRGLPVTDAHRERLRACRDAGQLDRWTRAAITAATTDEALTG